MNLHHVKTIYFKIITSIRLLLSRLCKTKFEGPNWLTFTSPCSSLQKVSVQSQGYKGYVSVCYFVFFSIKHLDLIRVWFGEDSHANTIKTHVYKGRDHMFKVDKTIAIQ